MLSLNVSIIITLLTFKLNAYSRAVILSPAIADIFIKLNIQNKVIGVTKHIKGFKKAVKVGTHIKPNIEIIKSLKPDIIFISSYRFFPKEFADKIGAEIFIYNPYTLDEILKSIKNIGKLFNKEKKALILINNLENKLKKLKPVKYHPKVIYEIMSNPYIVAGEKNIINDIIIKAGGINLIKVKKKLVRYSQEKVRFLKPDVYIYQTGPMNKNPDNPLKRVWFKGCKFHVVKVKETQFARPNTKSFDNVIFLNKIFHNLIF